MLMISNSELDDIIERLLLFGSPDAVRDSRPISRKEAIHLLSYPLEQSVLQLEPPITLCGMFL